MVDIWLIIVVGGSTLATIIWLWKTLSPSKTATKKQLALLYSIEETDLPFEFRHTVLKDRYRDTLPLDNPQYLSTNFDYPTFNFDSSSFDSSSSDFGGFDGGDSGGSGGGGHSD